MPEARFMFDCQVHGKPVPHDVLGGLRDSTSAMADSAALQARMCEDGYVFLRGVLGPSSIAMARHGMEHTNLSGSLSSLLLRAMFPGKTA